MSAIIQSLDRLRLSSPDKTANSGSQQALTWPQFHAAVMSLTPVLDECRTLGLCMHNSPAWIVADISAINAGVTNIPLAVFFNDAQLQHVTGRNRHRIITGYGRNISPEWLESELVAHPSIGQAAVFGDELPALTAVVVPATALDFDELLAVITQVNNTLPDYARIDDYILADQPFTLANSELTAGGTPARNVIKQRYADQINNLGQGV